MLTPGEEKAMAQNVSREEAERILAGGGIGSGAVMACRLARTALDALARLAEIEKELDSTQTQLGDWIVRADEANVRAEKAEAERDRFCVDWGNQCRHSGNLQDQLAAAEADRYRLAAQLAVASAREAGLRALLKKCRPSVANMAYGRPEYDDMVNEVDAALATHTGKEGAE